MKELRGSASADVRATREVCLKLVGDVERYPDWYPDVVRRVEVVERRQDGSVQAAQARLHVPGVPLISDVGLLLRVEAVPPGEVRLVRIPHGADDEEEFQVTWELSENGSGTRVEVSLDAQLSVPRLVPVGGLGETLADGFIEAAARALDART